MKVAILAGGVGSRLQEETRTLPKPMVRIGPHPILWHIMSHYSSFGYGDFVIALGYLGDVIKRYFVDHAQLSGDLTVDLAGAAITRAPAHRPAWRVELAETGLETNTGGRIKRLAPYIGRRRFMLTWGDGLSDVNLDELLAFHKSHGKLATVTAVRPPARFGMLELDDAQVTRFVEKPATGSGWINGAFFVLEPEVFDYIEGDGTQFEHAPLENLALDGQLMAYRHEGFWQCMDTLHEKQRLEAYWRTGDAPWARREHAEHADTGHRT